MARRTTSVPDVDYAPGLTPETNPRLGGNFRTAPEERQAAALAGLEAFAAFEGGSCRRAPIELSAVKPRRGALRLTFHSNVSWGHAEVSGSSFVWSY